MNKKNDLIINKIKCNIPKLSNNDKWQYESFYKYQPLFSYKDLMRLFNRNTKQ